MVCQWEGCAMQSRGDRRTECKAALQRKCEDHCGKSHPSPHYHHPAVGFKFGLSTNLLSSVNSQPASANFSSSDKPRSSATVPVAVLPGRRGAHPRPRKTSVPGYP
eukprot:153013-Rhodomonas_salina.1